MVDKEVLIGSLMEDSWLTLEQVANVCQVEPDWLLFHIQEGLFPHAESVAGVWRITTASVMRARRMHDLERNFEAVPELAALMADMLEELDCLRARLGQGGR